MPSIAQAGGESLGGIRVKIKETKDPISMRKPGRTRLRGRFIDLCRLLPPQSGASFQWANIMRNRLTQIVIILAVLVLSFRLVNWAAKQGPALPALPNPNGYDDLLAAGGQILPPPADLIELTPEQVRSLADHNRPAVQQARHALQTPCMVSLKPTKPWDDHHEIDLRNLKRLAFALGVEDKIQLLNQHTNEAAQCDLDILRLADAMRRGGLVIDGINSLAADVIGDALLQEKLPRLDAETSRQAALAIETMITGRELPDTTFATEHAWSRKRFGLVDMFGGMIMRTETLKRQDKYRTRSQEIMQRDQRLMLRLAAHAYELDNHQQPANAAALVPHYLKTVPKGVETGRDIEQIPQTFP
jgi:hypothetical protein